MSETPNRIKIGKYKVGEDQPVFIIAEAGVNHNGSLKLALKLVDAAAAAGANAVKFQTFRAEDVVTGQGKMAGYQLKNIGKTMTQLEMIKKFELPEGDWSKIIEHCGKKDILFLSTPHGSFRSIDLLQSLKVSAFKFGSGDLTNLPVLKYAARLNKPVILGTGMATLPEVREAVECIKQAGNDKIIVLHCTTNYPCPVEEVNLKAMLTMRAKLRALVGYSDHTLGIQAAVMAATIGACVIEKHFTLDRKLSGPDHKASLEPGELRTMVRALRNVPKILGSMVKQPVASERRIMVQIRKSVVAAKDIRKGEVFTKQNLAIKRPAKGLHPREWFKLSGKKARRDFKTNDLIKL